MNTLIINFSSRSLGNCEAIANVIKENSKEGVLIRTMAAMDIHPCGNCKYECFEERRKCPFIKDDIFQLYEDICSSDLVYYIVPNYSDYPCSNFFIFNERGQCFFTGKNDLYDKYESIKKMFIVVSNTEKENFIGAFNYHSKEEPNILFLSSRAFNKSSIKRDLLDSEEAKIKILKFISTPNM